MRITARQLAGVVAVTVTDRDFYAIDGRRDDGAHESWLTSCIDKTPLFWRGLRDIGQKSCGGRRDGLFRFGESRIAAEIYTSRCSAGHQGRVSLGPPMMPEASPSKAMVCRAHVSPLDGVRGR